MAPTKLSATGAVPTEQPQTTTENLTSPEEDFNNTNWGRRRKPKNSIIASVKIIAAQKMLSRIFACSDITAAIIEFFGFLSTVSQGISIMWRGMWDRAEGFYYDNRIFPVSVFGRTRG